MPVAMATGIIVSPRLSRKRSCQARAHERELRRDPICHRIHVVPGFISAYVMQPSSMIIEMRTYKIEAGKRGEFVKILETKVIPAHQKIGVKILGPFLSGEDNDTFFWMRAFPDQQSREQMRNEFYEGKLWKEELEQKLMSILEKYDVVVVEAKNGVGEWR
jgi:hypothetical protein